MSEACQHPNITRGTHEPAFIPPLKARGKAVKYIDHGREYTVARADSRGLFVPGADEQNAAYIVHAANCYPDLVATLRDLAAIAHTTNAYQHAGAELDADLWSDLYQRTETARAILAKCEEE